MKGLSLFSFLLIVSLVGTAQEVKITTKKGDQHIVNYRNNTFSGRDIRLDSGELLAYEDVSLITTSYFDAYDKVVRKTGNRYGESLGIQFTGDQSYYAAKLQKLKEKREGAHIARGAGTLMAIIGAFSGDEDLYKAGVVTYGVGTIAKDINTERTLQTQTDAIVDLENQQKQQASAQSEELQMREDYGNENVDGAIALVQKEYDRALALANVGETSKDANHRLAAVWLKAIIYADQDKRSQLEEEYKRLIVLDPEVSSIQDGDKWMEILLSDLKTLRE